MGRIITIGATAIAALAICADGASASTPTATEKTAFPTLRGTPSQVIPKAIKTFAGSPLGRQFGVDAGDVYRSPAPGGGFWSLLPGAGGVCAVFETNEDVAACADTATAVSQGIAVRLIRPRAGLLPDGSTPPALDGPASQIGIAPATATGVELRSDQGAESVAASSTGFYASALPDASAKVVLRGVARKKRISSSLSWGPKARAAWDHAFNICRATWCTLGPALGSPALPVGQYDIEAGDNTVCGNLMNADGSWAGSAFCTVTAFIWYGHPYNQTRRTGWLAAGVAGVTSIGTGWLNYNN